MDWKDRNLSKNSSAQSVPQAESAECVPETESVQSVPQAVQHSVFLRLSQYSSLCLKLRILIHIYLEKGILFLRAFLLSLYFQKSRPRRIQMRIFDSILEFGWIFRSFKIQSLKKFAYGALKESLDTVLD
uniref:Uncharacterized protein n=1 Tax=Cacopsylla melanoneura TaxID=428564 RepID=A0A8D9EET3_9HEMI